MITAFPSGSEKCWGGTVSAALVRSHITKFNGRGDAKLMFCLYFLPFRPIASVDFGDSTLHGSPLSVLLAHPLL